MTVKQRQHLLAFLGFYAGGIDGIWGAQSQNATTDFQKRFGLEPDGIAGDATDKALRHAVCYGLPEVEKEPTDDYWDEIEFFDREEFRCTCGECGGFPVEPDVKMVRTVDEIRRRLGVPVTIVDSGGSGIRCVKHNAAVGGVANSEHLYGRAADLHSSASPERMKEVAEEVMGKTGGIGLYSWGIHVDVGKYSRWYG